MLHAFGWAALIILGVYLCLFSWAGALAARAASCSIWLFGVATGGDLWAAFGFHAAFALSFAGPLIWPILPFLHKADPFGPKVGSVDDIANARMGKRRRMLWSPKGAHRVAVTRAAVLDGRLTVANSRRAA